MIKINIKNAKNIPKINALLKENSSDNIFIIKYSKKDKFDFEGLDSLFIDTEIKEFEKNKYLSYLIKSYKLDLTSDEINSIEITTANNYLALHNILKLKTLTSKNHIENHSTYEGFDIIASIFNDKQEIFILKIDKFLQSLNDPIQFNSLLFWFFKSVYRHKNNSSINLKNLNKQLNKVKIESIKKDKSKNIIKDKKIGDILIREQILKDFPPKELRGIIDQGKKEIKSGVIMSISTFEGKVGVAIGISQDLTTKFDAVALVKTASEILGGKGGGGRKDFAQAGGIDQSKIEKAFAVVRKKLN